MRKYVVLGADSEAWGCRHGGLGEAGEVGGGRGRRFSHSVHPFSRFSAPQPVSLTMLSA